MKPAGVDSSDITTVELLVQRRLVTKRLNASVGVRNEASCRESSRMLMRESILGFLAANYDFDVGFFLCEDQGSGDRDAMSKSWPRQKGKYVSYIIKKDMYFLVFVRGPVSRCQISLQIFFLSRNSIQQLYVSRPVLYYHCISEPANNLYITAQHNHVYQKERRKTAKLPI